jgi:hypothetical protein
MLFLPRMTATKVAWSFTENKDLNLKKYSVELRELSGKK